MMQQPKRVADWEPLYSDAAEGLEVLPTATEAATWLNEYIADLAGDPAPIELTEEQKATVRWRAAELDADLSIGLTWDELRTRLAERQADQATASDRADD